MRPTRGFRIAVAALLAAAVAQRVAYVLAQPAADPAFQQPARDARYYNRTHLFSSPKRVTREVRR